MVSYRSSSTKQVLMFECHFKAVVELNVCYILKFLLTVYFCALFAFQSLHKPHLNSAGTNKEENTLNNLKINSQFKKFNLIFYPPQKKFYFYI